MKADVFRRYNRDKLSKDQQEFLEKLIPFARLIQKFSQEKCWEQGIDSPNGFHASIAIANIVAKSYWGGHDIARKDNNLSLIVKPDYWKGKSAEYGGVVYRSYATWLDYTIDFSDELTNVYERNKFEPVLKAKNLDEQIELFSSLQDDPTTYGGTIEKAIEHFGFWEFDN